MSRSCSYHDFALSISRSVTFVLSLSHLVELISKALCVESQEYPSFKGYPWWPLDVLGQESHRVAHCMPRRR